MVGLFKTEDFSYQYPSTQAFKFYILHIPYDTLLTKIRNTHFLILFILIKPSSLAQCCQQYSNLLKNSFHDRMNLVLPSLDEMIAFAWKQFVSKQQYMIYDHITGHAKYMERPFEQYDLHPDIIMKIKIPEERYSLLKNQPDLRELITIQAKSLTRAYTRAEKEIATGINSIIENSSKIKGYVQMFTSIQEAHPTTKQCKLGQCKIDEQQTVKIQCKYLKNRQVDLFTLRINTIIYILQEYCGFRVRSFILQQKKTKNKVLFIFMSISQKNLLRSAQKYRIKKEVYPSYIDFYVNDPSNIDGRPLKCHAAFTKHQRQLKHTKVIGRFFREYGGFQHFSLIKREAQFSESKVFNFVNYTDSAFQLFQDIKKTKLSAKLSHFEKSLIYRYTKKKNFKALLHVFTHHRKRQSYYYLLSKLNEIHGYKTYELARTFKEFFLPNKDSQGASFKNKLKALFMFVPQAVNAQGGLDFFSRMEKTKLCYMTLKSVFKIGGLNKLDYKLLTLSNEFQKFGAKPKENPYNFVNVVDSWHFHSFFTDIFSVRNYFGNNVSFEILIVVSIVQYLASTSILFIVIFLVEQLFNEEVIIFTRNINSALFVLSFQIFLTFWKQKQSEFIKRYSGQHEANVFRRGYKGPYVRNTLNDQPNQFINTDHSTNFIGNLVCTVFVSSILTMLGFLFFTIRLLLRQLYYSLDKYYFSVFSLGHFIAYFLYFIILMIFEQSFARIFISALIKFLNPSTLYHKRKLTKKITFLFLLGVELIAPLFFLVIEPLNNTSCFADSCILELQYYVSSRHIFVTALSLLQLVYLTLFKKLRKSQTDDENADFQGKLEKLMERALLEANKKDFKFEYRHIIFYTLTFTMYCTLVTNACLYSLLGMFVFHLNMRLKLLYHNRRPIDKSEEILPFLPELKTMYLCGIIFNAWIIMFGYDFIEEHFQIYLQMFQINTVSSIFLIKIFLTAAYTLALLIFGEFVKETMRLCRGDSLINRLNKKLKQHELHSNEVKAHYNKTGHEVPLKSIFRTFNDDQIVKMMLLEYLMDKKIDASMLVSQTNMVRKGMEFVE